MVLIFVACAAVLGMLGIRPLTSDDLGYHLAYGLQFWQEGRVVDHSSFIYTLPPIDAAAQDRPPAAAGSWYDDHGRYRFPNANWLTQVLFAGVFLLGGFAAMNVLLVALVWGFFAASIALMRRLKVPMAPAMVGVLLMALMSYVRFTLRPELPALIVLALQACLLARVSEDPERPLRWRTAIGLISLQVLLVNLHISFYIGLGLTGAVLIAAAFRWMGVAAGKPDETKPAGRRVRAMLALLSAQVAVCFVNPWTWRIVALPMQTAWYMRPHNLAAAGSTHPWTQLGETAQTFPSWQTLPMAWQQFFENGFRGDAVRALLSVTLALAVAGIVLTSRQRRFARTLWIVGGVYLALTMFRGIPFAALLIVPAVWASLHQALKSVLRAAGRIRTALAVTATVIVLSACAYLTTAMVSGSFYMRPYQVRLGFGRSRVAFPEGPAQWLSDRHFTGRILTNFITSSNLYFMMPPPRPSMPVLTNIWAYPPEGLTEVFNAYRTPEGLAAFTAKYHPSAIVFRTDRLSKMLAALQVNPDWSLVYLDGAYAIFMSRTGPDAALADREVIGPLTWDVEAFLQRAKAEEIWPGYAMRATGATLIMLRWTESAIRVLEEAVEVDPTYAPAWRDLGYALANRSTDRQRDGDTGYVNDLARAVDALERSLEIKDNALVRQRLGDLKQLLAGRAGPA